MTPRPQHRLLRTGFRDVLSRAARVVLVAATAALGASAAEPLQIRPQASNQIQTAAGFDLVLGRLRMVPLRPGQSWESGFRSQTDTGPLEENLKISLVDRPSLNYQLTGPQGRLQLRVANRHEIEIVEHPAARERFRFWQPAAGPLLLHIGEGDQARRIAAPGFWHVYLAERKLCRERLAPLLEQLRPGWDLLARAAQVERELEALAQSGYRSDIDQWRGWLGELAADSYELRNDAERRLRKAGLESLAFLVRLDQAALEPEQRFRVRRMIRDLSADAAALEPAAEARALAGDTEIWWAGLAHPEASFRRASGRALAQRFGRPLEFDPDADEETRARQRAAARAAFEKP